MESLNFASFLAVSLMKVVGPIASLAFVPVLIFALFTKDPSNRRAAIILGAILAYTSISFDLSIIKATLGE